MSSARPIPKALTIAGVDPSGGAGVLADVKAMSALGAYACGVVAALTAQNTQGVTGVLPIDPAFVAQQIDTLFADVPADAVKIGMLGSRPVTEAVAGRLAHWQPPHVVLDPVMVAKSGDTLLARDAVGALREALLPQVTMITPNLPEAGVLLEQRPADTLRDMRRMAERLREQLAYSGERWVFLKGGHLPGDMAIDLLHDGDRMIELSAPRIDTRNTHGTGCTLSAALAALLPQSQDVPEAARRAKHYLTEAIRHADRLGVGAGHGPVHHFHGWW
ncbi:MAG: bifunctional hydroxymethylpyrimidine kinase/phosphomethylpyrimidine kinase [Pigmentiphaga sp.]|uniref:bifunctional hydroxymethylpyrimidine kinase/phosphomethylpyrimidine kinase n=1 Tax=Pigmentiphaga sp. TaxID=1977564 RepID=UPI0029B404BB|nr:bifunctional hydroxymethylpyrimidine kinase/phosphomethylpyrimidine kinase [Pigmentiphaga sp.]MDX3906499.1 bifunctional hydroxymethylpyrimidine kinase/phosphomethylpyrimidine kinase [Pigmentiphaga sp.]